ncbi:MAG: hypothetical protein ACRDTU_01285 [Micromonosporaceae bacterium]
MSEHVSDVTESAGRRRRKPEPDTVGRRTAVVQILAGFAVGAAISVGALGAFAPLLRGDVVRGLVVVALLLTGAALAVWAPFRLRGWPAAVSGCVIAGGLRLITELDVVPASDALTAAAAMAAGFAVGGVLSALTPVAALVRGLTAATLVAGLVTGAWGYPEPYVAAGIAVVAGVLAALWVRPPGAVTLAMAPMAALLLAAVLSAVVVRGFGTSATLVFVLVGPVLVGVVGCWLTSPGVTERQ